MASWKILDVLEISKNNKLDHRSARIISQHCISTVLVEREWLEELPSSTEEINHNFHPECSANSRYLIAKVEFSHKMVMKDYCAPYQHKMDQKYQNLYQLQSRIGMEYTLQAALLSEQCKSAARSDRNDV